MPPCPCSIRALDLFVRDFAGLTLRQPCTRRLPTTKATSRPFSAVSRARTVESTKNHAINDDFVPFELGHGADKDAISTSRQKNPPKSSQSATETNKDYLKDEWHAEIEIIAPWPQETRNLDGNAGDPAQGFPSEEVEAQSEQQNLELNHEMQTREAPSDSTNNLSAGPLLEDEPALQPIPRRNPAPERTRAENRQARKLRRLQHGTYRQEAEGRRKAQEADAQMNSVLKKIEDIEGDEAEAEETDLQPDATEPNTTSQSTKPSKQKPLKAIANTTSPPENPTEPKSTPASRKPTKDKAPWQTQKAALALKFGDQGWAPRKRVSPDTLDGIRALHASDPASYSTETLASHFKITPEAIRRILKSKWRPNTEEVEKRRVRWEKRGERKWRDMAAQGTRPPAKWRAMGIKTPMQGEKRRVRRSKDRDGYVQWQDERGAVGRPSLSGRIL